MLVVNIELWPHGCGEKREALQRVVIGNDGTGDAEYGNYNVWVVQHGETPNSATQREPDSDVRDYLRAFGALILARRALWGLRELTMLAALQEEQG